MKYKTIIAIAVYDTEDNERTAYTKETYYSLKATVNPETTRIVFIDNDSCKETKDFLKSIKEDNVEVLTNTENVGTAEAINMAIKQRKEGQYVIKMDNDVVIHNYGWVEEMIRCFEKDSKLGILGLKRKDLPNSPWSETDKTELKFLPHDKSKMEPWLIIEESPDIIGTCTMYSPLLLDKVGYLWQPSVYGFDDVLMCARSRIMGFYNAFYPSIEIDHIDDGKNPFTDWKKRHAGIYLPKIEKIIEEYKSEERDVYYNPYGDK